MSIIWRVSKYLFSYRWLFWTTQGLAIGMTLLAIAVPKAVQHILSQIQDTGIEATLWTGALLIGGLYFGSELLNGLRIIVNNSLEQKVLLDMRRDIHRKLLRLPVSFYDQRKSGEISSRVIEDVANVERALLDGTEIGGRAVVMLLGVTIMLYSLNSTLALFVTAPIPILLVVGYYYSKGSRKFWKRVREASGEMSSLLVEDIQGNRLIQTFALQDREQRRFERVADDLRQKTMRAMYRWAIYNPSSTLIARFGLVSVICIGGYLMLMEGSSFQYDELIAFILYSYMLYEPLWQLHNINHLLSAGKASGERVFEILDAQEDIQNADEPVPFPQGLPQIVFKNVDFNYHERATIVSDFHLTIPAGKVTALVGHTGAGKSTIANLAMRTYDVTGGAVLVNGVDVREIDLGELHRHIGHVAQDPFLFEGTVRDNLLLAREDAEEPELIAALEGAAASDFVLALPKGLDTNIGEKGIRLSQGEKQRLTIARILLKNPPFVILDEATASVDTITERKIQQALENLMARRTVLVIAHRLSTVRKADNIVVIEGGAIVESGSHDELLLKEGHYADLWQHQIDIIDSPALF